MKINKIKLQILYTANQISDNVTRIRASSGAVEGATIEVGSRPTALAFDGVNNYAANYGGSVSRF